MRVEDSDFSVLFLAHAQYHKNINVIMMILTSITTLLGLVDRLISSLAQDSLRQVLYLDSIVLVSRASAGARD